MPIFANSYNAYGLEDIVENNSISSSSGEKDKVKD